jgi:hypothetical protein
LPGTRNKRGRGISEQKERKKSVDPDKEGRGRRSIQELPDLNGNAAAQAGVEEKERYR